MISPPELGQQAVTRNKTTQRELVAVIRASKSGEVPREVMIRGTKGFILEAIEQGADNPMELAFRLSPPSGVFS